MKETINVIIVEDEAPARLKLCEQLTHIDDVKLLGVASSVREAEDLINRLKPNLIFLDVKLSDALGFELLKRITYSVNVIFTTAYSHYAADAFDVHAIDYLRKPYPLTRLEQAIDKVREYNGRKDKKSAAKVKHCKLPCYKPDRTYFIEFSNIQFIRSGDTSTLVIDESGEHVTRFTLNQLEDILPRESFVRLHRQFIINIDWILEIQPWAPGKPLVIMNNSEKTELKSSRSGAAKIKSLVEFS